MYCTANRFQIGNRILRPNGSICRGLQISVEENDCAGSGCSHLVFCGAAAPDYCHRLSDLHCQYDGNTLGLMGEVLHARRNPRLDVHCAPMYFLGGIQIFCVGMLGEYLVKIYAEVKSRPRFFIEKMISRAQTCQQEGTRASELTVTPRSDTTD